VLSPNRQRLAPWSLVLVLLAGAGTGLGLGVAGAPHKPAVGASDAAALPDTSTTVTTGPAPLTAPPPSTVVQPPSASAAELGNGFGVVAIAQAPNSLGSELEMTTDFVHWRDITPPIPGPDQYGEDYVFTDIDFINEQDGWVAAFYQGGGVNLIYRTTDGGASWRDEGQADCRDAFCETDLDFVGPLDGWRKLFGETGCGCVQTATTSNGGATWTSVSSPGEFPSVGLVSASGPRHAFSADTLPPSTDVPTVGNSLGDFSPLWVTSDSGATWQPDSVALPPDLPDAETVADLPSFFGDQGVLPMMLVEGARTVVAFYVSEDAGATWSLGDVVSTSSQLTQGQDQWPATASGPSGLDGDFPSVAVASPGTWWVIGGDTSGAPVIKLTSDFGATWTTLDASGFDPLVRSLQAPDATTAWAMVDGSQCGLEGTRDGGATWVPVCPGT
jgi:photosystem II stability/assembly factor-like uncharacterized protein